VILPGVVIGEGAAIGANSLVTKDCEPWKIYAGSPAKVIKTRPQDKILELETQLRQELYDARGNYIPKNQP
jgi:galactoside O-acetyltransferase